MQKNNEITDKYIDIIKKKNDLQERPEGSKGPRGRKSKEQKTPEIKLEGYTNSIVSLIEGNKKATKREESGGGIKGRVQNKKAKKGRIRKSVMGKRVDYSARTVIGPDPDICADEICVPKEIAKYVTYPVRVCDYNRKQLLHQAKMGNVMSVICSTPSGSAEIVIKKKKSYKAPYSPVIGDVLKRFLDKGTVTVDRKNIASIRKEIYNCKFESYIRNQRKKKLWIVNPERALLKIEKEEGVGVRVFVTDGHYVILNRQPSLRVESLFALKMRVVDGKTIRFNLNVTTPLNADFDGDECNLHFVQGVQAAAETATVMSMDQHIVSAQRSCAIMGLVQDGVSGTYIMTRRNGEDFENFVTKEEFFQCITVSTLPHDGFCFLDVKEFFIRASRYYPEYLTKEGEWKQSIVPARLLYSTLFPRNLFYTKMTHTDELYPLVKIERGIICKNSGPLCKKVISTSKNSIIFILWKEYSPEVSKNFISRAQFMVNYWLSCYGYTMSLRDCSITSTFEKQFEDRLLLCNEQTEAILEDVTKTEEEKEDSISLALNSLMNFGQKLASSGMEKNTSINLLSKEDTILHYLHKINSPSIKDCNYKQGIKIAKKNGKLLNKALSNVKTTRENNIVTSILSGSKGNFTNCMQIAACLGQQNVMGGKRIPKSISSKSRTLPCFDFDDTKPEVYGFVSSSFMKGLKPHEAFFHAASGREGIMDTSVKTSDTGYLQRRICKQLDNLIVRPDLSVRDYRGDIVQFLYGGDGFSGKMLYFSKNGPFFIEPKRILSTMMEDANCFNNRVRLSNQDIDYVISKLIYPVPKVTNTLRKLLKQISVPLQIKNNFLKRVILEYEKSLVNSGENVGAIASCSIGEISTQLTLNSFHYSGISEANTSSGVARLEEIVGATKSQKTSTITVPVNIDSEDKLEVAKILTSLVSKFEYKTLDYFISSISVEYNFDIKKSHKEPFIIDTKPFEFENWLYFICNEDERNIIDSCSWILKLNFDKNKLLHYNIDKQSIENALNVEGVLSFVSPICYGQAFVFIEDSKVEEDLASITKSLCVDVSNCGVVNKDNFTLFYIKNVLYNLVKSKRVCGFEGVEKVYIDIPKKSLILKSKELKVVMEECDNSEQVTSNNIPEIYEVLGIEAARELLLSEITQVLNSGGDNILSRHLELLADFMTKEGKITPMNRSGVVEVSSTITKCTFEKMLENFALSAAFGEREDLGTIKDQIIEGKNIATVSGSIVSGKKIPFGTGSVICENKVIDSFESLRKEIKSVYTGFLRK